MIIKLLKVGDNMENPINDLKLENQLCFLLYASSREMTKQYKPLLEKLEVTYPQYLVLLLLWEHIELSVKRIGELLYLDSGTLTPMLKRMEQQGIVSRERSSEDERLVIIKLTEKGQSLKDEAKSIPNRIVEISGIQDKGEFVQLKNSLLKLLESLTK